MNTVLITATLIISGCIMHAADPPQDAVRSAAPDPQQIDSTHVPRDTYFTLASAQEKVRRDYPSARPALPVLPEGVAIERNVCYRTIGTRHLTLDVFLPPRPDGTSSPAVLLIHGGGWRSGNRTMEEPMALQLAARGYVAATIEYRLSPEARYPAAIHDLKEAVRWMRVQAQRYGVDTARIAVLGCSSGAHLATLLGVTNGNPLFEEERTGGPSSIVQAIVNIDGPVDFTHPEESGKDIDPAHPSSGARWIGRTFAARPDLWREASPLSHLSARVPPTLFVNSAQPRYHVGRDAMIDTLRRYVIHHEVHTLPDTPHTFWLFHPWQPRVVALVGAFLDHVFGMPTCTPLRPAAQ